MGGADSGIPRAVLGSSFLPPISRCGAEGWFGPGVRLWHLDQGLDCVDECGLILCHPFRLPGSLFAVPGLTEITKPPAGKRVESAVEIAELGRAETAGGARQTGQGASLISIFGPLGQVWPELVCVAVANGPALGAVAAGSSKNQGLDTTPQ